MPGIQGKSSNQLRKHKWHLWTTTRRRVTSLDSSKCVAKKSKVKLWRKDVWSLTHNTIHVWTEPKCCWFTKLCGGPNYIYVRCTHEGYVLTNMIQKSIEASRKEIEWYASNIDQAILKMFHHSTVHAARESKDCRCCKKTTEKIEP